MPNLNFLLDATGLANTQIYKFGVNGLTPLEPNAARFETQMGKGLDPNGETFALLSIKGNNAQRLDTGSADAAVYNWLGLQVFSSARISDPDDFMSMDLLTVLFEIRQDKNIDKVSIAGVNGTIKTYINDSDFQVNMKIILTTDNATDYPLDDVKRLTELLRRPKALNIVSDFIQLFDIYNIVVESFAVAQLEATQNTAIFEVAALSDTPIELIEDV